MKTIRVLLSIALPWHGIAAQAKPVRVVIETALGAIEAEIDTARAPLTARNFLKYVDRGFYTNAQVFRVVRLDNQPKNDVKIEVIQAGPDASRRGQGDPAIELERTSATGLHHLDGTLSMARGAPNTATNQFFICIGNQPELDFGGKRNADGQGFAAFGRVTRGMEVVRAIQQGKDSAQTLSVPVQIREIRRAP